MKYKGKKIEGRNSDILVLLKGDEKIVFKAEAVENYDDFEKLVPEPKPPLRLKAGGTKVPNLNDPEYIKNMEEYGNYRTNYFILKTLENSPDLEWETVDITKSETWDNWKKELTESGFTEVEKIRILNLCTSVNCLNDDMLEAAKADFLSEERLQKP